MFDTLLCDPALPDRSPIVSDIILVFPFFHSRHADPFRLFGEFEMNLGNYSEAVASYHRAIQLDYNAQLAYENLKRVLLNKCKTAAKLRESV